MPRGRKTKPDPLEYDFHGLTASEAESKLRSILTRHQGQSGCLIRIIHGKGTGILADLVLRIARADPRVLSADRGFLNPGTTDILLNEKTRPPARRGGESHTPVIPSIRKRKP